MASVLAGGPAQSSSADDHPSPLVSQAPSEQDLLLPSSSSPDASSNPSPWPPSDPTHHRHSRHAQHALQTLASLADQATSPPPDLRGSLGITHNLEAHGWLFHGVTSGVRIFSMEDEEMEGSVEREGSRPETTGGTEMKIKVRQGIRESESLPWFRGEGWVEGAWRVEDVAATLRSYGARAMWDGRFDALQSFVVAALSATDSLSHLHIKGSFPVGDRDASVLSTFACDAAKHMAYVATVSVDDPLIPKTGTRTTVHLNGVALRPLPRSPHFEPPTPVEEAPIEHPARPAHRRTKSSISLIHATPPSAPAPPIPPLPAIISRGSSVHSIPPTNPSISGYARRAREARTLAYGAPPASTPSTLPSLDSLPRYTLNSHDPSSSTTNGVEPPSQQPGMHVSLIVRASPGGNLPQTYVNALSLSIPLNIFSLNRYLLSHGFAPYLVRTRLKNGLEILEESFDASAALYRVVFRVSESQGETRIRFHGSTFARGMVDVEVLQGKDWRLEYDVEPENLPQVVRDEGADGANDAFAEQVRRRTSLSIISPTISPIETNTSDFASPATFPSQPLPQPSPALDPAILPGPLGGCTLVFPNHANIGPPVTVTIKKSTDRLRPPIDRMRCMSHALGEASRVAFDGKQSETVEELIDASFGEGQAEAGLEGAKEVLRAMRRAKQEERGATSGSRA